MDYNDSKAKLPYTRPEMEELIVDSGKILLTSPTEDIDDDPTEHDW